MMIEKLTPETIRELWGKTYNTEGKPDWSHLFPYYHEAVVFQDSIQRIEGIEDFKAMCARVTERCEQLNMAVTSVVVEGDEAFLQWTYSPSGLPISILTGKLAPDRAIKELRKRR